MRKAILYVVMMSFAALAAAVTSTTYNVGWSWKPATTQPVTIKGYWLYETTVATSATVCPVAGSAYSRVNAALIAVAPTTAAPYVQDGLVSTSFYCVYDTAVSGAGIEGAASTIYKLNLSTPLAAGSPEPVSVTLP